MSLARILPTRNGNDEIKNVLMSIPDARILPTRNGNIDRRRCGEDGFRLGSYLQGMETPQFDENSWDELECARILPTRNGNPHGIKLGDIFYWELGSYLQGMETQNGLSSFA